MFSSRICMISGLKFKSLIHFELIYVYGIRFFFSLHVVVQFFQQHLLKRLSLVVN